ncbi:hypothetical protein BDR04DRAFT_1140672 [Suillus decipiens]|nr:hypothetical protein BDR04DRAFT_1140672 [Suillus decipiens]
MIFGVNFTADTGTDFYDRSPTSRRWALVGVACSSLFSYSCIVAGIITLANHGVMGVAVPSLANPKPGDMLPLQNEILALALNLIVTLSTESTGFVHGISLRSALASESRLRFNTNLRLLTAARGWYNPNGALINSISAVLLIISYSAASLVVGWDDRLSGKCNAFVGLPLLILGVAIHLQVMIAFSGMWTVKILTWSSSPLDLTAALVHHIQVTPASSRCMRCVSDLDTDKGPVKPSEIQPSAWGAHPSIRKVVISLWGMVAACAGWAAVVMYIWHKQSVGTAVMNATYTGNPLSINAWSFFVEPQSNGIYLFMPLSDLEAWGLAFFIMTVIQGPLTLGLHLSELIVNVIRDERQWRLATEKKGLITATNPVMMIFRHRICFILFIAKPFLHWMFGLSFMISNIASDGKLSTPSVHMWTAQIWNLFIALFIFTCFLTFVALRRPRGPQPAAYGHVQTLANLVDEWSPVMWWGHKKDGIRYCHAGTSDHPLPHVKMDCVYAGPGAGSLVPFS